MKHNGVELYAFWAGLLQESYHPKILANHDLIENRLYIRTSLQWNDLYSEGLFISRANCYLSYVLWTPLQRRNLGVPDITAICRRLCVITNGNASDALDECADASKCYSPAALPQESHNWYTACGNTPLGVTANEYIAVITSWGCNHNIWCLQRHLGRKGNECRRRQQGWRTLKRTKKASEAPFSNLQLYLPLLQPFAVKHALNLSVIRSADVAHSVRRSVRKN